MLEITTITVPFMLNVSVNCYLIKTNAGFILIDTGTATKRDKIEAALIKAGCTSDNLKLIILTHGDFDHCGNAAYLGEKFNAPIAIHEADKGMVTDGDMFYQRKQPNFIVRFLIGLMLKLKTSDRFTPDVYLKEGDILSDYGFNARVIELPGHSRGSIGLLSTDGHLFCGDLLANTDQPALWSIIDDEAAADTSVEKLKNLDVQMVYPGHGQPFPMHAFMRTLTHALSGA